MVLTSKATSPNTRAISPLSEPFLSSDAGVVEASAVEEVAASEVVSVVVLELPLEEVDSFGTSVVASDVVVVSDELFLVVVGSLVVSGSLVSDELPFLIAFVVELCAFADSVVASAPDVAAVAVVASAALVASVVVVAVVVVVSSSATVIAVVVESVVLVFDLLPLPFFPLFPLFFSSFLSPNASTSSLLLLVVVDVPLFPFPTTAPSPPLHSAT